MIKKLKLLTMSLGVVSLVFAFAMAPAVSAQDATPDLPGNLCGGANQLKFGGTGDDCGDTGEAQERVNNIVATVINIFSVIVGIVAVIMIIFGGFKYITSGGDSNNVSAAKTTILYAIVGLVIVALAQVIVRFVLARATNSGVEQ